MRRFLSVGRFFLPLYYASCASGSCGRWIGRSVPSCPQGELSRTLLSGAWRAASPTHRRYERAGGLGRLRPGSARCAIGESPCWHASETSHRAVLELPGLGAASHRSGGRVTCRPGSVRDKLYTADSGSCGVAHQWYGAPCTS